MGLSVSTYLTKQPNFIKRRSALVLNADYRPLSYFPLSVWPWQESVKAKYLDRVTVVAEYDEMINSPSLSIRIPSVVVLRDYVKHQQTTAFTRFNLFLRDEFSCQYCGRHGEVTFDHVLPKCRGGKTSWENVVAACAPCNLKKGARDLRTSGLKLRKIPAKPSIKLLINKGRKFPPNYLHDSWIDYLYWDTELDT